MSYQEDTLTVESTDSKTMGMIGHLIVYNDDFNSFDWVIQCFVEILDHTWIQAEQCSILIHFKGKCVVKTDSEAELKPLKDALVDRGLSAVIEQEVV